MLPLAAGAVALVMVGLSATILILRVSEDEPSSAQAAARMGCAEVTTTADRGTQHVVAPPRDQPRPATSGPHWAVPLPTNISVYDEPFDPTRELQAVHNLEHGNVLIYYRDDFLEPDVIDALVELANAEPEVILAPYPVLPDQAELAFVAWRRLQTCAGGGTPADGVAAAEAFIERFRNGAQAPEPQAAQGLRGRA